MNRRTAAAPVVDLQSGDAGEAGGRSVLDVCKGEQISEFGV
jgi:hypothetical protein